MLFVPQDQVKAAWEDIGPFLIDDAEAEIGFAAGIARHQTGGFGEHQITSADHKAACHRFENSDDGVIDRGRAGVVIAHYGSHRAKPKRKMSAATKAKLAVIARTRWKKARAAGKKAL